MMSRSLHRACCGLLAVLVLGLAVHARAETFRIDDIRVQGLQRVSAGTVFNLLPANVGDFLDEVGTRELIRALFDSGYFDDIRVLRDGGVLLVVVTERPAISALTIDGNKAIPTEALLEGLASSGLEEGEIFQRATLERMRTELERQYVAQGRYGASIETTVTEEARNRVKVDIVVDEGKTAKIRHINIVGNTLFSDEELQDAFELKLPNWLSWYRNDDKYSREKLGGDLETLESYYQDRGYADFRIVSTQVSISDDKRDVFITVNVDEGEAYEIGEVELVGELRDVSDAALRALLLVQPGQKFSRALITSTEERLTGALGNSGYTFASATGIPQLNEDGTADVRFVVDAGQRVYVRRINFRGNTLTLDDVLRREMRQLEGGWASQALIDLSKVRLERLGYFREVSVETPPVAGSDNQIDVEFTVEEQPTGSITGTVGFAQRTGLILAASYNQNNVFGTGNSTSLGLSWSAFQRAVNFSYFNPYFTLDGISRGFNLFYRETDFDENNIVSFNTDSYGGGVNFGYPISETARINFGFGFESTSITEGVFPAQEISAFIDAEGADFFNYTANASYASSTFNRGLFPTAGRRQSIGLEVAVPGSELTFWRVRYTGDQYFPLWRDFALHLRAEVGYADGYGDSSVVPFYEHFYAGGFGSVRGFQLNSLGPQATPADNDFFSRRNRPFGGNLLTEGSVEVIIPMPFVEDKRSFRPVAFFDFGNVFNTDCPDVSLVCSNFELSELRYSLGLGITWITGLGPITVSAALPFNSSENDREEIFQFELGRTL